MSRKSILYILGVILVSGALFLTLDYVRGPEFGIEDKDPFVRADAVKELSDQVLLAKVALNDKDSSVRGTAVEKLNDQALLVGIALKDDSGSVRMSAVRNLTDQTLLARIAETDRDANVRLNGVLKLTDQTLLAKIAIKDPKNVVRYAAIEKLTDQALLAEVALELRESILYMEVIRRLTDQTLLAKVAIEGFFKDPIFKLTDQSLLVKVALQARRQSVRDASIKELKDETLLTGIALNGKAPDIRLSAVKRLLDIASPENNIDVAPGILQFVAALLSVPKNHRPRLTDIIFPAIDRVCQSDVINENLGKITDMQMKWTSLSKKYGVHPLDDIISSEVKGEEVRCSIKFEKLSSIVEKTWSTIWPETIEEDYTFIGIEIGENDMFTGLQTYLPDDISRPWLAKIAVEDNDKSIRRNAKQILKEFEKKKRSEKE